MRYYCCFLIRQFEEINWIYWRDNVLMVIYMFPFVQFLILICDYQFVFKNWCIHVLNDEWHSTPATLVFSLCMAPCHSTWWFYWFVQGLTLGNIIWGYTHIGVCFSQRLSTLTEILGCATLSCWCDTISMRQFWWFFHTAKINQREGVACQNYMEALPTNHDDSCKWEIVYRVELKKIWTLHHHQTNLVVLSNTILFYF